MVKGRQGRISRSEIMSRYKSMKMCVVKPLCLICARAKILVFKMFAPPIPAWHFKVDLCCRWCAMRRDTSVHV